jgi:tetratricopeptide (TPR) repeat protein
MTPAFPDRSPLHRVSGAGVFALALAGLASAGCGARLFSHRGVAPVTGGAAHVAASRPAEPEAHDPRDPFWAYRAAEHHVGVDSVQAAEAELRQALALDPTYAPALALLSKLYFATGRHREAVTLLEPVRLQPDVYAPPARQVLLAGLALHEDALGDAGRARAALAPVLDGGGRQTASVAAYVTLRGETPDDAAELARDAARHDGRSAVNQNNLGITRLRAGDVNGARKAFADAIGRDASLPGPYYNLAILEKYYRFDDAAAARWFAEYWNRSHDDPDGLRAVFASGAAPDAARQGARP